MVIHTSQQMSGILQVELMTMVQAGADQFDQACFVVALQVIHELTQRAEQMEREALNIVVEQHPGLVGANGEPLSRPARRKIEKLADETQPDIIPIPDEEAQA
jgi:hypothetical protein